MLRLAAFVAILVAVRGNNLERNERGREARDTSSGLLEEPNSIQSNIKDASLNEENKRILNENDNLLSADLSDDNETEGSQGDFNEENVNASDDIQDDFEVEEENDSDDIQDDSDKEDDSDSIDNQDESNKEDYSESENTSVFGTEDLHRDSLSELHDMISRANPGLPEESKRNFEDKDIIDGDIKLDEESAAELVDFYKRNPQYLSLDDNVTSSTLPDTINKRKVIKKPFTKWRMPIKYRIKTSKTNEVLVKKAMKIWQKETCIRFKEKKSWLFFPPGVTIRGSGNRCWAHVGKKLFGNTLNLGKGCQSLRTALHELGHTLGLYHEQSRPDRNNYVIIKKGNIQTGKLPNFLIRPSKTYGTLYDYGSIMHYSDTAFAKESGLKTIVAKQANYERTMGQRIGLSFYDIKAANYHYCQKRCKGGLTWSKCRHGGYRNPKKCTRCKCPDGWTGKYCTYPSSSKPQSTSCGNRYRYATSIYKSLTSPGYFTSGYTKATECTWKIRAPVGKRVRLFFSFNFRIVCHKRCLDFVEVRHRNLSVTGPRFCCYKRPNSMISVGRDMLILFRTYSKATEKGFRAYYKYI